MSIQELLAVVYRFYARGVTPYDPGYRDSEEERRLADARRAAASTGVWERFLKQVKGRFPELPVESGSLHLPTGEMDACYIGKLWLPPRGDWERARRVGFLVSFIVPSYVVYSSSVIILGPDVPPPPRPHTRQEIRFEPAPDEVPYARAIVDQIKASFPGSEPMPPEIGNIIVPDVVAGNREMGRTTLYDCLFTDNW